ncbi:MAG: peptidylprolyl isomerase [Thermodesulfovibrionales bacterium]
MASTAIGDTVRVHYTGRLADGSVFDTSIGREPLEFTIGDGRLIPGFEKAVIGMNTGETKTIILSPEEAYGPYLEELTADVEISQFPPHIKPEVGLHLQIRQDNGSFIDVIITKISGSTVTLDANHPLAGKELTFDIELLEIL